MDFLFAKDRTAWVFLDRQATKVGPIFERDMAHGEALTVFDHFDGEKAVKKNVAHAHVEDA